MKFHVMVLIFNHTRLFFSQAIGRGEVCSSCELLTDIAPGCFRFLTPLFKVLSWLVY